MDTTAILAGVTLTLFSGPDLDNAGAELQRIFNAPAPYPACPLGGIEMQELENLRTRSSAPPPTLEESEEQLVLGKKRLKDLEELQKKSSCYVGTHTIKSKIWWILNAEKRIKKQIKKERRKSLRASSSTPTKDQTPV